MSEIEELIKQIEEFRQTMVKAKEGHSYSSPEVVAASQKLDAVRQVSRDANEKIGEGLETGKRAPY